MSIDTIAATPFLYIYMLHTDGESPRPLFFRPSQQQSAAASDDDGERSTDGVGDGAPSPPDGRVQQQAAEAHEEYFRISNIRIDLEEERRVTKELRQQLGNCERE